MAVIHVYWQLYVARLEFPRVSPSDVNDNGGIFGQHVWTEIFMGNAGWIPVDATADEIDFIDSGHIRLGEQAAFLPKKMKILEYRCTN